jgi:transcriptional regulator with XRE-family HTH domain
MTSTAVAAAAEPMPDPQFEFPDKLRKARLAHGSTQREFADLLGVKHPTYAAWEIGTTRCPRETAIAKRIEFITGIRAAWILGVDTSRSAAIGWYSHDRPLRIVENPQVSGPERNKLGVPSLAALPRADGDHMCSVAA